jgi:cytochrome b6-f complex iron-sulfur subunit
MIDVAIMNAEDSENHVCQHNSRREFLKKLGMMVGGLTLVGSAATLLESCSTSPTGPLAPNPAASITVSVASLTANGQAMVLPEDTSHVGPDGYLIVIYRVSATSYLAHSMQCTHAGCQLDNPNNGIMVCACHGSEFNTVGAVLQGPAISSLTAYQTSYNSATSQLTLKFR